MQNIPNDLLANLEDQLLTSTTSNGDIIMAFAGIADRVETLGLPGAAMRTKRENDEIVHELRDRVSDFDRKSPLRAARGLSLHRS